MRRVQLAATVIVIFTALGILILNSYIHGAVATNNVRSNIIPLDYGKLTSLPKSTEYAELDCAGALVAKGNWTGARLSLLLEDAGVGSDALTLEFHARDGYTQTISYADAMRENVLIAYELNGVGLPESTRLVIPNSPGYMWVSMITEVSVNYPAGG